MSLQGEIDGRKKEIHADGYPMSIGEIIRLYEDEELDIHPEFQRFFRWVPLQKTKLIESILLGIPIPSLFVSQREDGVWDVVDGLQRLSTIFEFVGILREEDKSVRAPSSLLRTDYLPSLEGKVWDDDTDGVTCLTQAQRISFKREKLDIKILKKESDPQTKFELFQRLNTLGSGLSQQELRNCLLIMLNRPFFNWLENLSTTAAFKATTALSDNQLDQRYDMELATRFLAIRDASLEDLDGMRDVHEFLTNRVRSFASTPKYRTEAAEKVFKKTFDVIYNSSGVGENAFRRYDAQSRRFGGGFLVSAFEAVTAGVAANLPRWTSEVQTGKLEAKLKAMWQETSFQKNSGAGVRGTTRMPALVPFGRSFFA
jgi:hypothetical protein